MCITSLEKSERRLRLIGYYHRQKKEKFDGPETGSPRTTDRDIRFNILIVAKTILEREARDSRKFQGVDITVWNLLLAEIWEYVLTDLIVKIIVIKSGPLKIIRYTEIALKNWPNFENYCLQQNSCKILSKWIQFWIEKSNQRMYPNSVRTRTDSLLSKNFPLPSNLEKQLVQIKRNLICSPNIGSKKPFPTINV